MKTPARIATLVSLGMLAACATTPPPSASATDVAERWGLLGTWAPDCSKPPSAANPYSHYAAKGDQITFGRDQGYFRDTNEIKRVVAGADGTLALTIDFAQLSAVHTNVLVRGADGRTRMHTNYDDKGFFTVRDGILLVGMGGPTPWRTRCR